MNKKVQEFLQKKEQSKQKELEKELKNSKDLFIKQIPAPLHDLFKSAVAKRGMTIKRAIMDLMELYIQEGDSFDVRLRAKKGQK